MLQVRLGKVKAASPDDELGRARLGCAKAWTRRKPGRSAGGTGDSALTVPSISTGCRSLNLNGTVVAVATIRDITQVKDGRRRFFLEGKRIKNDPRVGQRTEFEHPSRNPLAYFEP
jgi:hypothetical protein